MTKQNPVLENEDEWIRNYLRIPKHWNIDAVSRQAVRNTLPYKSEILRRSLGEFWRQLLKTIKK